MCGTAETTSVDVDRPVELAAEVEGEKKRRTLPVLFKPGQVAISETPEELAREGAWRMLERALHSVVDVYLARRRYDRVDDDFSGYRNGYAREREISIGTRAVEVRPPRIADTPGDIPPFRIVAGSPTLAGRSANTLAIPRHHSLGSDENGTSALTKTTSHSGSHGPRSSAARLGGM